MRLISVLIILIVLGCSKSQNFIAMQSQPLSVESLQQVAKESFIKAEKEIYKHPVDDVLRPDPDPKKCICKGTGVIVHGDGHKTPCEYHGKKK